MILRLLGEARRVGERGQVGVGEEGEGVGVGQEDPGAGESQEGLGVDGWGEAGHRRVNGACAMCRRCLSSHADGPHGAHR